MAATTALALARPAHAVRARGAPDGILGHVAVGSGQDGPVDRARDALADGAAWRARDILLTHVEDEADPEALALLGEVLHGMGDLPRAGAMWFAAGVKGPDVDTAISAWREQSRDDFTVMWASLPASVRAEPRPRRIQALHDKAVASEPGAAPPAPAPAEGETSPPDGEAEGGGTDAAQVIAWVLAAAFVLLAVVGAVTVLGWIVPGG